MSKEWSRIKLSDYIDILIGGTPSRVVKAFWAKKPNGHPWLSISDMKSKYATDTKERISDLGVRGSNVKLIPKGSTIMSFKLSVGRTAITTKEMYSNEAIAAFLPRNNSINSSWLYHVLPRAVNTVVTDTAVKGVTLNKEKMAEMSVMLPCLTEQVKIAEILDSFDNIIQYTEAIIEKLKLVKQGLLHDLLTRGIDDNGELRPPQNQAPHLYKDSPLGWVPNEWMVELLDNVAERGSGHTPSKSAPSYWNGGIKWVSLADSHRLDHIYITETDKEISELGLANSSAVRHLAGTVILSRDAGVGKSAILAVEMAVSQHFIAWRCSDALNNLYLYFMLQRMKPIFESIAIGSTIKTIGLAFFKKLTIVVPSRSEQDRIVGVILSNEAALQTHSVELGKLRLQKNGLLDDLLTGRVRVTPLLDNIDV